ncbi:hypothetical protein MMC18_005807 [Xylographa bjoerkii]|nr:hypothetical protein [Xylographa bjoerkii]
MTSNSAPNNAAYEKIGDQDDKIMTPATGVLKDYGGSMSEKKQEDSLPPVGEEMEYLGGLRLFLVILALCLSIFLLALDNTIPATAIPKITDDFESIGGNLANCFERYLLTLSAFQLLFGKFYTFFPIKWVFLIAIGIFELGSLICGVAPTSDALIIGRAIAGLGGAGIFFGALIILAHSAPLRQRALYTGVVGAMYGVASVAGPLLGGVFTDEVTWRWCFYINLPFGAVTMGVITIFFRSPYRSVVSSIAFMERVKRFDMYGTIVFLPAILCLLLPLQWGGTTYPWRDSYIIALFVVFGVLISTFIAIQAATWFSFALGSSFFILSFYLPIWFQAIKGATAVQSGIDSLPLILSLVVLSFIAGAAITAFGQYAPIMTELDIDDVPTGTATMIFAQTLGRALFLSIGQTVSSNKVLSGLQSLVPDLDSSVVLSTGATSLASVITGIHPASLAGTLEAYNRALVTTYQIAIVMACLSIFGSLAID